MKLISLIIFVVLSACSSDETTSQTNGDGGNGDGGNGDNTPSGETINMNFNESYQFIYSNSKVRDRNFYWTTLIEQDSQAKAALQSNDELNELLLIFKERINAVLAFNNPTANQIAQATKFTDDEKAQISLAVKDVLVNSGDAFVQINQNHIEPSGVFNHFQAVNDAFRVHQLIVEEIIDGINNIIDSYAAGIDPLYPDIDRVSFDVNSTQYRTMMKNLLIDINNDDQNTLFYQPFLEFALGILELNNRDEAGRFVPLDSGVNASTINFIQNINWNDYEYSVIVVLGDAPNSSGDLPNISIGGMERSDRGVTLLNQGLAPIIAFTGSNVAPFQSQYHEAIEMKAYVMTQHNINANKILVDPHARHTTTNLRNIGRLMYRYGIPTDKKALVSTAQSHSQYVTSNQYLTRCMNEMNHIPVEFYERISDYEVEFKPLIKVLHLNSFDPLDP